VRRRYKQGTTNCEINVAEIRPKIMALHKGIHMGLLRERGITNRAFRLSDLAMNRSFLNDQSNNPV
jgi:hypothetical protein